MKREGLRVGRVPLERNSRVSHVGLALFGGRQICVAESWAHKPSEPGSRVPVAPGVGGRREVGRPPQ